MYALVLYSFTSKYHSHDRWRSLCQTREKDELLAILCNDESVRSIGLNVSLFKQQVMQLHSTSVEN